MSSSQEIPSKNVKTRCLDLKGPVFNSTKPFNVVALLRKIHTKSRSIIFYPALYSVLLRKLDRAERGTDVDARYILLK